MIPGISREDILTAFFPIPSQSEQKRIINRYYDVLPLVEEYGAKEDALSKLNASLPAILKKSILQEAIQGKLVPQDPNDEPASVLLERIRKEKERLVKEGKLKPDKHESIIVRRDNSHYEKLDGKERCIDDEIPFEIPDNWAWTRLDSILDIARGGSPRPIQAFLTNDPSGINWIKIGDTEKGEKYIFTTKERIRPEGIIHSRFVHIGDFLLTNSMSFGRPYILKTEGCIHDGWLVLSNKLKGFDTDFLYDLLSSPFAYNQFCDTVSGAVVKNLNSEKVAKSLFPLPPLKEQHRIVEAIESLFSYLDK
ncbi:MAG: restriction endonuclease subunit S [Lachnospiraceae bacterium]|nr:restriction endonuclease subunit S [Lachnospiraceae bacterium]